MWARCRAIQQQRTATYFAIVDRKFTGFEDASHLIFVGVSLLNLFVLWSVWNTSTRAPNGLVMTPSIGGGTLFRLERDLSSRTKCLPVSTTPSRNYPPPLNCLDRILGRTKHRDGSNGEAIHVERDYAHRHGEQGVRHDSHHAQVRTRAHATIDAVACALPALCAGDLCRFCCFALPWLALVTLMLGAFCTACGSINGRDLWQYLRYVFHSGCCCRCWCRSMVRCSVFADDLEPFEPPPAQ